MRLKNMSKKQRLVISVALALGTIFPSLGGVVHAEESSQYKDVVADEATGVKDSDNNLYAGWSTVGNSTVHNSLTVNSGSFQDVFGGKTEGRGTEATDKNESRENHVTLNGGKMKRDIFGGYTDKGKAKQNIVTMTGGEVGWTVFGGYVDKTGEAQNNQVTVTGGSTCNLFGGHVEFGNADGNIVNLNNGTVKEQLFGGFVFDGNANKNTVTVAGGGVGDAVYGGYTHGSGNADKNTVTVTGGTVNDVYGGLSKSGSASENTVDLGAVTVTGDVIGGSVENETGNTNKNIIHLRGTDVKGAVIGGSAKNGTDNTLIVHSHAAGASISDFSGVQNIRFYIENDAVSAATPMLRLGVNAKDLTGIGIGVGVSGGAKVLDVGESIRLMQTQSGSGLTTDPAKNQIIGEHGVSVRYHLDIKKAADDPTALLATVTQKEMKGQTKTFVETRAALTALVNHGGDALVGDSLSAARQAASRAKSEGEMERYQVWAGMGGSALRTESGSHVDIRAGNFSLGWARQDTAKTGQILFTPFVEYGRGSYDSYIDDETNTTVHGSGTVSHFGLGLLARLDTAHGLWYEGSIRGGRATSDYRGIFGGTEVTYDGSNTYYAAHLGIGKDIRLKGKDTITPYLRYFYAHQNGMTATLSSGEVYDFGSVDSQRVRVGFRYTHTVSEGNTFYAGLAWEYEFGGEATATYQACSAPSPSLKGSSGTLELGYRFAPKGQPLTYDLRVTGGQGIRRGFIGGAHINWAF